MYPGTLWFFTVTTLFFTQSGSVSYEWASASLRADSCSSNMSAAYVHVNSCYTRNKVTPSFQWGVPVIFHFHISRKNETPWEVYCLKSDKYVQCTQTWFPWSLQQYSSPAHTAYTRQSRLGANAWYKDGEMTGKKKGDESLPEQSAEWKPLPSAEEEFPSGCHPRMICFPSKFCTPVSRCKQCPGQLPAVPSPGSICEPSGANSSAPDGSAAPGSLQHSTVDSGASSHLITSSSKTYLQDTISTPVCSAGACSPPSATAELQRIIKVTFRRSASVGLALSAMRMSNCAPRQSFRKARTHSSEYFYASPVKSEASSKNNGPETFCLEHTKTEIQLLERNSLAFHSTYSQNEDS